MLRNKTYHSCSVVPLRLYLFIYLFIYSRFVGETVRLWPHTSFSRCLHNCFFWCRLTVPGPGAPGGSPARRQAARPGWGHAGSCRASEVCWLALNCSCWRWKSIRLYLPTTTSSSFLPFTLSLLSISLSTSALSPPAAPSAARLLCHRIF